jgi:hypothetical protein
LTRSYKKKFVVEFLSAIYNRMNNIEQHSPLLHLAHQ